MKVIKWERVWNDNREEKNGGSEREQWMIYVTVGTKFGAQAHTVWNPSPKSAI